MAEPDKATSEETRVENQTGRQGQKDWLPPGATTRATQRDERPGGPPHTPLRDRHGAGTPGGGTEYGGLGGTNVGEGAPEDVDEAELEDAMAGDVHESEDAPPYSGASGGAVGGTPAEDRSTGGKVHGGIRPGAVHRGDSTLGTNPQSGAD